MRRRTIIVSALIIALIARPGYGWNDLGHMVVAMIAYERLTDGERAAVYAMLRHHPHLREVLLKDRPANVPEQEWVFVHAAAGPDKVRPPMTHTREPVGSHSIYRYHHPTWHYANFAIHSGQRDSTLPARPIAHPTTPHTPADQSDIITQLDHSYAIVRGLER